jgi:hypothetical protein
MPSQKVVDQVQRILEAGKLEPYIRHIRFPRYKNLRRLSAATASP